MTIAVVAGPACTPVVRVGVGRHVVGRAPTADICIEDPALELHHGVIDVDAAGGVVFSQLAGRVPARVDGRPCRARQPLASGQTLLVGRSRIRFDADPEGASPAGTPESEPRGRIVPSDHDPWRRTVRRSPAREAAFAPRPVQVPEEPGTHRGPPAIGLVGAALAVAGAGLMAAVLGQLLFALFAAFGAAASFATWAIGTVGAWSDRRRATADHRVRLAAFIAQLDELHDDAVDHHRAHHLPIADALATLDGDEGRLWERRPSGAALRVTIGPGTCRWSTGIGADQRRALQPDVLAVLERCERLVDVPVPVELVHASVLAVRGDPAMVAALGRALVVQLAARYGPCDWRLLVVTDQPEEWDWVEWLPHAGWAGDVVTTAEVERLRDLLPDDRPDGPRVVVVTDVVGLLAARTGVLRRFLAATSATCIVLTADGAVPAVCQRVLDVGSTGTAQWSHGAEIVDGASAIEVAGVSRSTAAELARRLAPLVDPEDGDAASALPTAVRLDDIQPFVAAPGHDADDRQCGAAAIARRWRLQGDDPPLTATIGVSVDGLVDVDLVRDGPHGLIAGTTGSGKSELLRTLVVALAANVSPDHLTFVLVDFKGGSTFDACARLPHTIGVVTDLDGALAMRALVSLEAEVRRREQLLRTTGAADLTEYRRSPATGPLPRLVVVIDEFASLAREFPDVLAALVGVAQRGRSLGLHLLLATQRPAGVVTDDIRANTNLRLALRLNDVADAVDVVGDDAPAAFPRSIPGRAAMRLGPDELVVFQAASCTGLGREVSTRLRVAPYGRGDGGPDGREPEPPEDHAAPNELLATVELIRAAAVAAGVAPPRPAWLPSLPTVVAPDRLEPGAVGIVDDPANQRQLPLRWDHSAGNLVLVGSLGSGTTTTAIALVAALLRDDDPDRQIYVIDGRGDPAWDPLAESVDECGAVVRLHEGERLLRLLTRLATHLDGRRTDPVDIVLVVDGLAATRLALASPDLGDAPAMFERVLHDGPSAGIVVCATTDGTSGAGRSMPSAARWIFRLDDPATAASATRREPNVPAGTPGRLRIAASGLEAQIAFDPGVLDRIASSGRRAPRVDVLPEVVRPDELPAASADHPSGVMALLVGLASADLSAAHLLVPVGDHVLVGGAARTGKTTALGQLAGAWRELHPAGDVIVVDRRDRSGTADLAIGRADGAPLLLVVDDADRVADPTGALAEVVAGRHPGVTILASARLEVARVAYGHWVRDVARSHCGLVLTAAGEIDGELLGTVLPRRLPMPARPGLAWMIDGRGHQLVQVAARMPP